jgi:hypothetical protein
VQPVNPLPHADARERARTAARAAGSDPAFPSAYVDDARAESARLAAPETRDDDIRAAIAMVETRAQVSDVAPVTSTNSPTRAAKTVVRKAVFFTTHHLAAQISALGWATAWLGTATADRIEALERELAALRERVARLEGDDDSPTS